MSAPRQERLMLLLAKIDACTYEPKLNGAPSHALEGWAVKTMGVSARVAREYLKDLTLAQHTRLVSGKYQITTTGMKVLDTWDEGRRKDKKQRTVEDHGETKTNE